MQEELRLNKKESIHLLSTLSMRFQTDALVAASEDARFLILWIGQMKSKSLYVVNIPIKSLRRKELSQITKARSNEQ